MKFLEDDHLFWDTEIASIDINQHKQAIIERVLERGSWENIKELIQLYGKEDIREAIKKTKWFSHKTVFFVSGYFDVPLAEMKCYTHKLSNPIPYL